MRKIILIFAALCFLTLPAFSQWDGTSSPWTQGTGTQTDPYQISSPQHLAYLADMVCAGVNDYNGKYFLLTQDISLSNLSWMPIGDSGHPFKGNFDGNKHVIDSCCINYSVTNAGLFGKTDNSVIKDLVLYISILGYPSISGGIASTAESTMFKKCIVNGSLTGFTAGGIVGSTTDCTITNSKNNANVFCHIYGGGIVGLALRTSVDKCANLADSITALGTGGSSGGSSYVGGITGYSYGLISTRITHCYNNSKIVARGPYKYYYYGGSTGYVNNRALVSGISNSTEQTTIDYCYNTGIISCYNTAVKTNSYDKYLLETLNGIGNSVSNSYNCGVIIDVTIGTGWASASNQINKYGIGSSTTYNCYYLNTCGGEGSGNSRTEAQMKSSSFPIVLNSDSTVYVMDFTNQNNGYPVFWYTVAYDVTSDNATEINSYNATLHGHYGGTADTVGFIYGLNNGNPMAQIIVDTISTIVSHSLTGLQPNTQYRFAFFVKHNSTYIYGDTLTFTTKPLYNVSVTTNNSAWGAVNGGGTFAYGETATITAIPNEHYQFVQWSDGNTNNPRAITVTSDTSFTAVFEVTSYTINAVVNNSSWGSVTGAGEYEYNTPFLLTAIPTTGHYFDHWLEESTQTMYFETYNPLTFTTTRNETYTAVFATTQYTVNVLSNNDTMGWVSGGGTYDYNQQVYIAAHPMGNYIFTQWSDGNTDAYRLITVTQNVTYTASFTDAIFNITATANNIAFGVVTGSGSYPRGSQVQLTAVPNEGYHFTQWSDGNTDNPRIITVTADATYTAQFAANTYVVNVSSSNTAMGSAMGGGIFSYGQQTTIEATAMPHYRFVQWNDGVNSNPRIVTIFSDTTFIAEFEQLPQYTITVVSADETKGSVSGGGTFYGGEQTVISATATAGNVFDRWSDGNTEAIRTLTVTSDVTYTAYFSGIRCTVNVYSNDDQMGSVSGGGEYEQGSQATVTATPANGCRFVRWNNGVETNPYTFTVYSNVNLIANFEHVTGVDEIEKLPFTIATRGSAITIYGTDNSSVHIHDILGRTIYTSKKYDGEWIDLRSSGVYLVSVDENKPIKIVIIN